jgi:hypothetical protein
VKHRLKLLAVLPFLSVWASIANAGHFRCGGCSDPCRAATPVSACSGVSYGNEASGGEYASSNCGPSIVEAAPASCGYVAADGGYAGSMLTDNRETLCEPVTGYRVVMESQFVTETVAQCATETVNETRYRTKTVYKTVPIVEESYTTKTIMVPKTETKTVEYSVLVPVQSTKTVEVSVSVPQWKEVSENYTVKVPQIIDVPESYQVKVPTLRDESFTYTVYVPQTEVVTKMQTVTNAVPVTKTKTVTRCVPVYSTKTVTRDAGHYETVVEEVASAATYAAPSANYTNGCSSAPSSYVSSCEGSCNSSSVSSGCGLKSRCHSHRCGGCATTIVAIGCGSSMGCGTASEGCSASSVTSSDSVSGASCGSAVAPAMQMVSKQVWVPNVVTEEVPVVSSTSTNEEITYTVFEQQSEQIPYECTYIVNKPEVRTGTRQVVDYKMETRERTRKQVKYVDETRTRTRKELTYTTEKKSETYPVVTYTTEKKTKEISFTFNVPETTTTPVQTTRYEQVAEEVVEEYTVAVQVPTMKEVQVQVCKMVPKLVPYTYSPCSTASTSTQSGSTSCGSVATEGAQTGGCGCANASPVASSACGCGN